MQGIVAQVKDIFDQRESSNQALREILYGKTQQLEYLEKQTRDHAANLAKYGAHIEFNRKKLLDSEKSNKDFESTIFKSTVDAYSHIMSKVKRGKNSHGILQNTSKITPLNSADSLN